MEKKRGKKINDVAETIDQRLRRQLEFIDSGSYPYKGTKHRDFQHTKDPIRITSSKYDGQC